MRAIRRSMEFATWITPAVHITAIVKQKNHMAIVSNGFGK